MSGELDTQRSLLIKGKFSGIIRSASHVTIDKGAHVEACSISATSIAVAGQFSGSATASGFAEFLDKSRVSASVECASLKISPSCHFEGRISMPDLELQDLRINKAFPVVARAIDD
jgi:Integral membrane protein CcmA involved in cell shape determination